MPSIGGIAANAAKMIVDNLTPEAETERLIFRRFPGDKLAKAAENGQTLSDKDIETVTLKINPQQIAYAERKIIQKIPTAAPGRFVVFDWGSELVMLTITGCTGNLLPAEVTNGLTKNMAMLEGVAALIDPSGMGNTNPLGATLGQTVVPSMIQNVMFGSMSYYDLLNLSPKYKVFTKLRDLYHNMDADFDVLTLEMGEIIYRGFFEDFSFDITAESPWNWKYSMVFVSMEDLSQYIQRGDDKINESAIVSEGGNLGTGFG